MPRRSERFAGEGAAGGRGRRVAPAPLAAFGVTLGGLGFLIALPICGIAVLGAAAAGAIRSLVRSGGRVSQGRGLPHPGP